MAHWNQQIVESFLHSPLEAFLDRVTEQNWETEPMYVFIIKLIEFGLFELACYRAGIDDKTAYAWKNENDKAYHEEFSEVVKKGRYLWAENRITGLRKKGGDQWQSEAWQLERMMPDEFKEHKAIEETGDTPNTLTKLMQKLDKTNEENQPSNKGFD